MIEHYIILITVSFFASWLTFFCGFGLGTLLTPVFFLLFKDLTLAVASTAIVHFTNNLFKFILMKKSVNWKMAGLFGLGALPFAFIGAQLTNRLDNSIIYQYSISSQNFEIISYNLIFGIILIGFALIELIPSWSLAFSKQHLSLGGAISGFFGGLSGHQGAIRTAFLIKYQLDKNVFIATGIIIALMIDLIRTPVYFSKLDIGLSELSWTAISLAILGAIIGAITGKFFLKKMNIHLITISVSVLMLIFGLLLIFGILG